MAATGMVDQHQIIDCHLHEKVARLEVAHAIPANRGIRCAGKILDAAFGRFGLRQPVGHAAISIGLKGVMSCAMMPQAWGICHRRLTELCHFVAEWSGLGVSRYNSAILTL